MLGDRVSYLSRPARNVWNRPSQRPRLNLRGFFMPVVFFFAAVCLAMIASMGLSYNRNARALENNIREQARQTTLRLREAVDKSFENAILKIYDYSYDQRILDFISVRNFLRPRALMDSMDIIRLNQSTHVTREDIADVLVYFPNASPGGVLFNRNSYYYPQDYYESQLSTSGLSPEAWRRVLSDYSRFDFTGVGIPNSDILVTSSIAPVSRDQIGAVVLIRLGGRELQSQLRKLNPMDSVDLYVLDGAGDVVLFSTQGENPVVFDPAMLEEDGSYSYRYAELGGGNYLVTQIGSSFSDLRYVMVTPAEIIMRDVSRSRNQTVVTAVLFLLLASLLFLYSLRKTYGPVKRLVSRIMDSPITTEDDPNEIRMIDSALSRVLLERDEIVGVIQQHLPIIRNSQLLSLLNQQQETASLRKELADAGVHFAYPCFAVVCVDVESTPGYMDDPMQDRYLAKMIVTNIAEDILQLVGEVYSVEYSVRRVVLILNISNAEKAAQNLTNCAQELLSLLQSNFKMECTLGLSGVREGLTSLHELYLQAEDALSYKFLSGAGTVNVHMPGEFRAEHYDYPAHVEQSLINLVSVGDDEKALALLKSIFDRNFRQRIHPVRYSRCLYFDIASTILKLLGELKSPEDEIFGEGFNMEMELLSCETASDAFQAIGGLITALCAYIRDMKRGKSDSLLEQIMAYISANYTDSQICIASIAGSVGITENYLSHYFKEKNGATVMRCIESLRVEHIRRLLCDTDMTLSAISEAVGLSNSAVLIRVFKKHEGITPGQFRAKYAKV